MEEEPFLYPWPEEPLFCLRCGTTVTADTAFCPRCGERVEREEAPLGWPWYLLLAFLAAAFFLLIAGLGALGVYRGLEERSRLSQGETSYHLRIEQPLPDTLGFSLPATLG